MVNSGTRAFQEERVGRDKDKAVGIDEEEKEGGGGDGFGGVPSQNFP